MLQLVVCDEPAAVNGSGPVVAVWRDDGGRVFARAFGSPARYDVVWTGVGRLAFSAGSPVVSLWPETGVARSVALDRFARFVQPVVLQALGAQTLHASAVRTDAGVIAFCGVSGSGKSTLAFALAQREGITQLADDALVIASAAGALATPLPFQPRLREPSQRFFGVETSDRTHTAAPDQPVPLTAVFMLSPDPAQGSAPGAGRVPAHQAFAMLLRHAHCFDGRDRSATKRMVQDYLSLAARVPVFVLAYAPDFSAISNLGDLVLQTSRRTGAARA